MLTVKEVADRLKISCSMVYRLISKGEIACIMIGRAIRVPEEELQEFIERNQLKIAPRVSSDRTHF